jgi:hypothetical protein
MSDTAPEPHRHRWPDITFFMDDGHPWMTLRCPCGAERRVRAYERYWDPDTGPNADGDMAAGAGRPIDPDGGED